MLVLNSAEKKEVQNISTASKGQHQAVTMWEKRTPLISAYLVRDGQTHIRIITLSHKWEITTSVGIPVRLPHPKCGASPVIPNFCTDTARFRFVPLWRLLTSLWIMIKDPTRTRATHMPPLKRKTFHPRSQSALPLWWRLGMLIQMHCSLFSTMTMERSGIGFRLLLRQLTQNSHSYLKTCQYPQIRAKPCSTHSSGPGFASPKTQTLP